MTFLKKFGSIVLKIVGIATGLLPMLGLPSGASKTVTGIVDKLQQGFAVIISVEQIFAAAFGPDAKKGSDKLRAAVPQIAGLIQNTDLLIGKHPKDEKAFEDAATRLTAALADILNSYGE